MLFSVKWDRIEHGTAIEFMKDGTTKTTLFGVGPLALDYVKIDAPTAPIEPYYKKFQTRYLMLSGSLNTHLMNSTSVEPN